MEDPDKLWNGILNDIKQGKYEQQYKDITRGQNFLNIAIKHNAPEKVVLDFIERLPDLIEKLIKKVTNVYNILFHNVFLQTLTKPVHEALLELLV